MTTKRLGAATILANHFSTDVGDIRDSRYHYGRTGTLQIFSLGDGYFTATKVGKKPPLVEGYRYDWKKVESWVSTAYGWDVWEATETLD